MKLRYFRDIRAVVIVFLTIAMHVAAFGGWMAEVPAGLRMIYVLVQTFLCFICCVINHNHTHLGTFVSDRANRIFSYLLTMARGHSSLSVTIPHNLNHHVHAGGEEDWSRPGLMRGRIGLVRIVTYLARAMREMARARSLPGAPRLPAALERQRVREVWLIRVVVLVELLVSPKVFLIHGLVPWFVALQSLLAVNLFQHDGCEVGSEFNHSRNFVGRLGNWMLFNNGFHTVHHLAPRLHWSEARREHEKRVRPFIRPELDEPSLLLFIGRRYLLGIRPERSQSPARR